VWKNLYEKDGDVCFVFGNLSKGFALKKFSLELEIFLKSHQGKNDCVAERRVLVW
jgi:hypothetical protein